MLTSTCTCIAFLQILHLWYKNRNEVLLHTLQCFVEGVGGRGGGRYSTTRRLQIPFYSASWILCHRIYFLAPEFCAYLRFTSNIFFLYKHWTSPWSSTMPSYQAFKCVLLLISISCHFLWFFINDFYLLIKEFESLIICLSFILMPELFFGYICTVNCIY